MGNLVFYQTFNHPLIKILGSQKKLTKDENSSLPIFLQLLLAAHCTTLSGNTLEANCRKCNSHKKDFILQQCSMFKRYSDITVVIFCSRSYDSDRVLYYKQLKDCIRQWQCVVLEAIKGLHVAAVCRIRSYYSLHLCSMQRPSGHHCVSLPWPS